MFYRFMESCRNLRPNQNNTQAYVQASPRHNDVDRILFRGQVANGAVAWNIILEDATHMRIRTQIIAPLKYFANKFAIAEKLTLLK